MVSFILLFGVTFNRGSTLYSVYIINYKCIICVHVMAVCSMTHL